jgi:hypothetical protein
MFNCMHLHTELTSTSHVNSPSLPKLSVVCTALCAIHRVFNLNCKLVSCVTHPREVHHSMSGWTISLASDQTQQHTTQHNTTHNTATHNTTTHNTATHNTQHSNTQHTIHQTLKIKQICCILFRSYCYVTQTSSMMTTEPKHVAHGQNSLLVICKFGVIHWSALLHQPLTAQWNVHILSSLLKLPKAQKLPDCACT